MKTEGYIWNRITSICLFFLLSSEIGLSQGVKEESRGSLCGPYALMVAAKTLGIDVDMISISHLAGTTRQGTSMKGLADAAHQLGIQARGMKLSLRQLINLKPPIIAYVNSNHYLLIEQIFEDKLRIVEIDKLSYFMSFSEFEKIWDGYVLTVSPKSNENQKNQPNIQVDQPVYDFGVSDWGKVIEHTFILKNTGNSDLVVRDVLPGCSCSGTKIVKNIISPSEQVQLFMSFDIEGR